MNAQESARDAAVAALAHRLRDRDATSVEERTDPELFAAEFVTAQIGVGWRITSARRAEPWQRTAGSRTDPESARARVAEIRAHLTGGSSDES